MVAALLGQVAKLPTDAAGPPVLPPDGALITRQRNEGREVLHSSVETAYSMKGSCLGCMSRAWHGCQACKPLA